MKTSKSFTVLTAVTLALTLLTGAIAAPILCRAFYYAHIGPLRLAERTGLTEEEIKTAFDEMMDYCTGAAEEFSTGVLKWSESGKSHFTDVRGLFQLDLNLFSCGLGLSAALAVIIYLGRHRPQPILSRGPAFWAGVGLGSVFALIAALAALNFDRAFVVFHALFFPGKNNWLFNPNEDQIINILPQEFFRNCAILILAILVVGCAVLIVFDLFWRRNQGKKYSKLQKF